MKPTYDRSLCSPSLNPVNSEPGEAEQLTMAPKQPPKRRRITEPPRNVSPPIEEQVAVTTVPEAQISSGVKLSSRLQQARDFAVAQAQQDGVLGNYKIFDSLYGNFLVPVIPTARELADG